MTICIKFDGNCNVSMIFSKQIFIKNKNICRQGLLNCFYTSKFQAVLAATFFSLKKTLTKEKSFLIIQLDNSFNLIDTPQHNFE